ncbi:uncharacterized protein LOC143274659 [Babylonia areolata]|uniref:uncharacterized protein LOC143274659 n=1 Tax=Babylonia areolata TaxID=304850 RepID=UPI003FD51254
MGELDTEAEVLASLLPCVVDLVNLATRTPSIAIATCLTTSPSATSESLTTAKISKVYLWSTFVSGTLIVVMSVDRCLSVVMPFKARSLLTYRSMVWAIVLSYLIPLVFYLPSFLGNSVKWMADPLTNRSIASMVVTSWFPSDGRLDILIPSYLGLVAHPGFFIVVVVSCIITTGNLRQATRKRSRMTLKTIEEGAMKDNRITVMLLFLCLVYAVLMIPRIFLSVLSQVTAEFAVYKKYHNSAAILYHAFIIPASCLNSTVNFFAYVVLSNRFRVSLKEMLFFCGRK